MPFLLLLLMLALGLAACDRAVPDAGEADAGEFDPAAGHVPAVYERVLLFLAGTRDAPVAGVFDFTTQAEGGSLRRAARVWVRLDGRWDPLLDETVELESMQAPWRPLPQGPLRVLVGEADELEALVIRGAAGEVRLAPASPHATWGPDRSTQLRIRRGQLRLDARALDGLVLDVQFGRALPAAADSTGPPRDDAFLTDGADLGFIVAGAPAAARVAWLRDSTEDRSWDGVLFDAATAEDAPPRWRLIAPQGDLHGEIEAVGPAIDTAPADGLRVGTRSLFAVRGWIEVRGRRRAVFGILRRGDA